MNFALTSLRKTYRQRRQKKNAYTFSIFNNKHTEYALLNGYYSVMVGIVGALENNGMI